MKDGKFETQAEIFQALLDGKKIRYKYRALIEYDFLLLKDGKVSDNKGNHKGYAFNVPEDWTIYEEPKPRKKVTLYNYTYEDNDNIWESGFTTKKFELIGFLSGVKLLKTESKEIEVDDV